ncbi:MAG: NUDIX hydrolase [Acidobacteriota bacterium]|nr:NUDIX hydrolase [Acidobacteriota bacterium]
MTTRVSNAPRPAATVVVVRPSATAPFDVLLVRRNDRVAFMAGAYVFPGGRVDDSDRTVRPAARFLTDPPRFPDLSPSEEMPYRVAASRELEEEAGVRVEVDDLVPLAHWVTPEVEPRRYDTRFYLTLMPEGQVALHDEGETVDLIWASAAAATARCLRGEIQLPPPTWTTLRQLERHLTLAGLLAWAAGKPIARVEPVLRTGPDQTVLTLPGDPSYPTIEGWDVPEETRFVLREGRGWLPTRL